MVSRLKGIYLNLGWLKEPRFLCVHSGRRFPFEAGVEQLLRQKRLIFLGENHGQPEVVELEVAIVDVMRRQAQESKATVKVFLEHFSLEQQSLIDKFVSSTGMGVHELLEEYSKTGDEGHSIQSYTNLLQYAKDHSEEVKMIAAFVPRRFARVLVKDGEEAAFKMAANAGYMKPEDFKKGSDDHYDFFESLISGRDLNSDSAPGDRFKKIFPAQVFKDTVMANVVNRHIAKSQGTEDTFIVICGSGHCDYGFGVPERVQEANRAVITVRDSNKYDLEGDLKNLDSVPRFRSPNPGDLIFFFDSQEDVKSEIAQAYDSVAATADRMGNAKLAEVVLRSLGYSEEQIQQAGKDVFNYQGVGNPHRLAHLSAGETVLDLGSGLGVDSFIASAAVGNRGKVYGLDISKGEVTHATKRAEARGSTNVTFVHGDMDHIPLPDASIDCVISNGAFCLAPDKGKAFREVFRVLKPNGRFSIACTTLLKDLDSTVDWPICMRVFMPLRDAEPLLSEIGFESVDIDTSDSKMVLEIGDEPEEDEQESHDPNGRKRIHVGSAEFEHLKEYNMNELCARVVLTGRKPKE